MVINPIVGVYIPIITIPIKGEMTIPNIGSLDPGTYNYNICSIYLVYIYKYIYWQGFLAKSYNGLGLIVHDEKPPWMIH